MFQMPSIKMSKSDNPEDYCFKPMLVTDDDRVMLMWGQYEKSTDTFTLRMKHFSSKATYINAPESVLIGTAVDIYGPATCIGYYSRTSTNVGLREKHILSTLKDDDFIDNAEEIIICELAKTDELLFVESAGKGLYRYWLETATGYKSVVIDDQGKIGGDHTFENNDLPVKSITNVKPVHVKKDTVDPRVTYNYNTKTVTIINNRVEHEIDNVFTIPLTIKVQNGLIISWLTCTDKLIVEYYNAESNTFSSFPNQSFAVEYLIGAQVDDDLIVIGGYSKSEEVLKLNYYRFREEGIEKVDAHFWRSEDYKGKYFDIAPLNKGFMLISEGPKDPVMVQRFTHLGTWLYPLKAIDDMPSYSPTMNGQYITYLRDGQVWLRKIYVDKIPEIASLELKTFPKI